MSPSPTDGARAAPGSAGGSRELRPHRRRIAVPRLPIVRHAGKDRPAARGGEDAVEQVAQARGGLELDGLRAELAASVASTPSSCESGKLSTSTSATKTASTEPAGNSAASASAMKRTQGGFAPPPGPSWAESPGSARRRAETDRPSSTEAATDCRTSSSRAVSTRASMAFVAIETSMAARTEPSLQPKAAGGSAAATAHIALSAETGRFCHRQDTTPPQTAGTRA